MQRGYVQVPNAIARHGNLSLEAVGLLVRLLSLPDGSGATVEKITDRVPNGRRTVSKAMNELIEAGYVKRARLQDPETGRWVTITTVTDTPESEASPTNHMSAVGETTSRAVGGSPIGRKTKSKKDITPPAPPEVEEEAPVAPESTEKRGEGESDFLSKIGRGMAREARLILSRLSLHKSLPLSDQEIARLAPRVVPWLREAYSSDEILQCLTAALPEQIDSAPGLISHRLKHFTPERMSSAGVLTPRLVAPVRVECDGCQRPIKNGTPGDVCTDCRAEMTRAADFLGAELHPSL
ncbi:helix-turn-helix domain-containing protein [Streptomyces sp. NPDC056728]